MGWRRTAIAGCAAIATLAGATSAVASVAASTVGPDQLPSGPVASSSDTPPSGGGRSAAYSSQLTIALDPPAARCESFPDADGSTQLHAVCGAFLACYHRLHGPSGPLGLPTGDEQPNRFLVDRLGDRMAPFRGGTVFLRRQSGELAIGRWFAYTPSAPAQPAAPAPHC